MPEKYVPNSSVMGGGAPRRINFFGRDKIGVEKPEEVETIEESGSPAPDSPSPGSPPESPPIISLVNPNTQNNSAESNSQNFSSPAPDSPPPKLPHDGRPQAVDGVHADRRPGHDSLGPGSPPPDSQMVNLWSSLPKSEGHLRMPNVIIDHLYQLLDLQERSVYEQLYRLSHGYGKSTCRIGYPQLAIRSGVGRSTAIQTVDRLEKKGLISRQERKIGGRTEQGIVYWVSGPGSPAPDSPHASSPQPERNKEKDLKENIKKGSAAHKRKDYSECPDCHGTGMWYPEGYGKGVDKCRHEKLR